MRDGGNGPLAKWGWGRTLHSGGPTIFRNRQNRRSFASLRDDKSKSRRQIEVAGLVPSKGVADGEAEAGDARGAEVQIVIDQVQFRLGTDEEVALGIELDAGAEVSHEVLVARVVGVVPVAASLAVDAGIQCADAGDQLKIGVAREFGRVNRVGVQKKWTKRKGGVAAVLALVCLPVDFPPDAEIVPEEHVAAKPGIGAAGEGDRRVTAVG